MIKKIISACGFAALIIFVLASNTFAGGWAVVTLDQLPLHIVVNESVTIGFMVRQHGRTPLDGLAPKISATRVDGIGTFIATANPQGEPGHYVVALSFPSEGFWNWNIDAFGMKQPMPRLNVLAAASEQNVFNAKPEKPLWIPTPVAMALIALGFAVGAFVIWLRARKPWAVAILVIAATVFGFGLALVMNQAPTSASQIVRADPSQVERGKAMFLAKGCIVCHQIAALDDTRRNFANLNVGPNLSNLKMDPGYLERWLRDPAALRPTTEMPRLGLSEEEIGVLIAFLLQ